MITKKSYFNPNGTEILSEKLWEPSGIHADNKPTGFTDFNRAKYGWDKKIYDRMLAQTWFPSQIDVSDEKEGYKHLSPNEQEHYKIIFAALSFADSAQEEHLLDFRRLTNNKIVRGLLTRQAFEELLHSDSYARVLDSVGNSNEVFDLYKTNNALKERNEAIADMFSKYINKASSSSEAMLLSALSSVNLEGIHFLLNFAGIYTIGNSMKQSAQMVSEISKDELNNHAPLFANIFKTIVKENKISTKSFDKIYEHMNFAVQTEIKFNKYLTDTYPILGFNQDECVDTIYNFANKRLIAIGMEKMFPSTEETGMQRLVDKYLKVNDIRTNFFEGSVRSYSKDSINMDF